MGLRNFQRLETSAPLETQCSLPEMSSAVFYLERQYFSGSNWPRLESRQKENRGSLSWEVFFLSVASLAYVLFFSVFFVVVYINKHLLAQACSFVLLKPTR